MNSSSELGSSGVETMASQNELYRTRSQRTARCPTEDNGSRAAALDSKGEPISPEVLAVIEDI